MVVSWFTWIQKQVTDSLREGKAFFRLLLTKIHVEVEEKDGQIADM